MNPLIATIERTIALVNRDHTDWLCDTLGVEPSVLDPEWVIESAQCETWDEAEAAMLEMARRIHG